MDAGSDLSALIADELWSLVGANSNPLAAGFVQEMVKTIRGLGGIAVTSTQGMQDLFGLDGGKYGKGILDSSRIKLVNDLSSQKTDEQLCLQCVPLFLSRIVSLLLFLGRSIGDSVASTRITSYSVSHFSGVFRPGKEKLPTRIDRKSVV